MDWQGLQIRRRLGEHVASGEDEIDSGTQAGQVLRRSVFGWSSSQEPQRLCITAVSTKIKNIVFIGELTARLHRAL